jgi:DNA-binding SARP family transcriptional activator
MQVLGPVRVWHGDEPADLGSTGERAVLGLLALAAGQSVSRAELVDTLWGSQPPPTARNIIQTRIKRLRRALEPRRPSYGPSGVLLTVGDGYALDASTIDLDLKHFRHLLAEAATARQRGDFARVAVLLAEALRLGQGEPLADTPALADHPKVTTLVEQRRTARVQYGEALLAVDAVPEATTALEEAVADQPLDEAAVALLIRAYRAAGQRARAFAAYHATRDRLAEELGIDPGPDLAGVHAALLTEEPDPPPAGPAQLPSDLATFVGRVDDLRQLDKQQAAAVVCVGGTAGVGKTTLVTHWAHRMSQHFPDGQLFADLRGFDEQGADPGDVLRGFLEALQVPAARMPSTVDGRVSLYRGMLAGRRTLVVLDNARDAEQVRPLLPGSPGSLVLVTSRNQLTGLVAANGAYPMRLDLLPASEARQLLERRLGTERIAGEPQPVTEIIERCAGLPLALAVVAARAATYPDFRLGAIAAELRSGLDTFASGDDATDLWTVFSASYRATGPSEQRLFRLMSLHPGPEISAPAAASLTGSPDARRHLAELTRGNLLSEHRPGRFGVHDLLRAYASDLTRTTDSDDERRAARHRMLAYYRDTARTAGRLVDPHRSLAGETAPATVEGIADSEQAVAWFTAERTALLAVLAAAERDGLHSDVHDLAHAMAIFFQRRGYYQDLADTQAAALRAATRLGDPVAQARSHRGLSAAYHRLRRFDESQDHLRQALDLAHEIGDTRDIAYIHLAFSTLLESHGHRYAEAVEHSRLALGLFEEIGERTGQARALNSIGWMRSQLGEHRAALAACERALFVLEEIGDRHGQGMTWDTIGHARHQLGDHEGAIASYRRAVDLLREAGDRYIGAEALSRLGDVHAEAGDPDAAQTAWRDAVAVLDDLGHPAADGVRTKLRRR